MKLLYQKEAHRVLQAPDGKHYLGVLCGTIGLYEVLVVLTDEEVAAFAEDTSALDGLADKVRYDHRPFADRIVTQR